MEADKLGIITKEISRMLRLEGFTKKVECKNYWDSHGTRIECAPTQYTFDREKKFEIWEVVTETYYSSTNCTQIYTDWKLVVEGRPLDPDLGRVMGYAHLKTKLKLDCCIDYGE